MTAVSCRVSAWILEHLRRAHPSPDDLLRNLPVSVERLVDPARHLDWDVFVTLCARLEPLLGGREALRAAAGQVAAERLGAGEANAAAGLTHPRQAYWLASRWLGPTLFPHLTWSLTGLPDGRLEMRVETPASERPCPQLFVMLEAALAAVPQLLELPPADLEVEAEERRAVFRISHAASPRDSEAEPGQPARYTDEDRYRAIAESSRDVILEISGSGEVLYITPNVLDLLGYEANDLIGTRPRWLLHPDDLPALAERLGKLLQTGESDHLSYRLRHRDGDWRQIDTTATAFRIADGEVRGLLVSRDVTAHLRVEQALRHSQEQLFQAQKMEAIGRLAGGVAHDFNNVLTAIRGYAALLLEGLGAEHPLHVDIEEIVRAAEHAGALTGQLLAFGRRQVLQPRVLDLNALVARVDRLLRRLLGSEVELVTSLDGELWPVKVDGPQIEQLIVNLALNARDAMPDGGRLLLTTGTLRVPEAGDPGHPGVPAGDWVTLTVRDTGVGMDPATVDRIFEPFFTTKASGEGTGLGLSTVYGIVQQSSGQIRVESQPSEGSTFSVYLPTTTESPEEPAAQPVFEELGGTETVLLVEDADSLRRLLRRHLEKNGYTVIEAASADEALRQAGAHEGRLDLLLTDVVLPKGDATALAHQLEQEHPELRVLYMSGFSGAALSERGVLATDRELLQKPFAPAELLRRMRSLLGRVEA